MGEETEVLEDNIPSLKALQPISGWVKDVNAGILSSEFLLLVPGVYLFASLSVPLLASFISPPLHPGIYYLTQAQHMVGIQWIL